MKRYILFGITLLAALPLSVVAQDYDDEEDAEDVQTAVRTFAPKVKQYETRTVKGFVMDATTMKPVAGVIIRAAEIDGYSTLSEDDGSYVLKVPVFATALYVTTPDYNAVRIGILKDETQKTTFLYPTTFGNDYATTTNVRSDYTASDFKYSNAVNIKDDIQKQLGAQVHTVNHNGNSGMGGVMFMQGLNSLNVNAQPLIVIDDVIVDQQYGRVLLHDGLFNDILSNINPADIEKVTVLRNGTALYGSKGANGVVLIQTRRNKSMATRITATASAGVTMEPKYISMMSGEQYRGYASELLKTTNTRLSSFKFLDNNEYLANGDQNYYYKLYHQNTDWKDYVYRTAFTQNYGINVEGGDDVANYNLSVGYVNSQSNLKNNGMDRLNVRFNTDIILLKQLLVRFDASFSNLTRNLRDDSAPSSYDEGTPTSPSFLAYVKAPFLSAYSYGRGVFSKTNYDITEENYLDQALSNYTTYNWRIGNPAAMLEYSEGEHKNRFENSLLNLSITPTFRFNSNLSLSEHFSYNLVNSNEDYYLALNGTPSFYVASLGSVRNNERHAMNSKQNSVMSDTRLDWSNRYDAHYVHLFGGARVSWESYSQNTKGGYNTGNDRTPNLDNVVDKYVKGVNENWNDIAWYAQAEYNYMSRYYLQANLTAESSSRFGKDANGLKIGGVQWGVFPSVQASWVMSNEPWFAHVKGIDYLRLSAGYDVSGNDDIDYYAARSYFRAAKYLESVGGLSFGGIGNTEIQWETTHRFNAGLEGYFIKNRLGVSLNYFRSMTDNLLTTQSLGFLSGLDRNWTNGGKLRNEGFDLTASVKVLALKDWQWQIGASVGHYKNKIVELPDNDETIYTSVYGATIQTKVGQAANVFYGFKTLGVFASTEDAQQANLSVRQDNGDLKPFEAGDMHFYDKSSDGVISDGSDGYADDRVVIGDPNPDIYGNIFTTLAWKRFKLDVRFNYSLGNDVFNYMRQQLESGSRFMNQSTAMNSRWQAEGQKTDMPRITFQDPMGNSRFSDRWIEDGSYLRLKSLTLSYDLPLNSEFIQGLQIWIQGNNLLTFTKYLGSDPEFSATSSVLGQGIDIGSLSQNRSVVAGVKINL